MRDRILQIRLTDAEYDAFERVCREDGVAPSTKTRELVIDYTQQHAHKEPGSKTDSRLPRLVPDMTLRVGEMFSGPGGVGVALNRTTHAGLSFEHIWAVDYDADTCRTYRMNVLRHYPDAVCICGDVRKLDIDALPATDGFLYDFSIAGVTKTRHGNAEGLHTFGVKYIDRVNPLFFFAEIIPGLSSTNEEETFKRILAALNRAGRYGYDITAHLYKFEEYGVPQTRHRRILIGLRGDLGLRFQVPKPSGIVKTSKDALADIPSDAANHEIARQTATVIERLSYIREGENFRLAEERMPEHLRLDGKGANFSQLYRRLDSTKPSPAISGSGGGGTHLYHWRENRSLTNRERARLQTFPDDFIFCGSKGSVRRQIGMAVPCEGARVILEALLKTLAGETYESVDPSVGFFPAKSL